jgi:hypothetical protein
MASFCKLKLKRKGNWEFQENFFIHLTTNTEPPMALRIEFQYVLWIPPYWYQFPLLSYHHMMTYQCLPIMMPLCDNIPPDTGLWDGSVARKVTEQFWSHALSWLGKFWCFIITVWWPVVSVLRWFGLVPVNNNFSNRLDCFVFSL